MTGQLHDEAVQSTPVVMINEIGRQYATTFACYSFLPFFLLLKLIGRWKRSSIKKL
jgi:hypothetical protein